MQNDNFNVKSIIIGFLGNYFKLEEKRSIFFLTMVAYLSIKYPFYRKHFKEISLRRGNLISY